jgi:hypothetical protein
MDESSPLELTPLIQELLSIIKATCRPSNPGWQTAFVDHIHQLFYQPPKDGEDFTAKYETIKHMRLLSVERTQSKRRPSAGVKTITNFGQ